MPAAFIKIAGELIQDAILESVEIVQHLNQHGHCTVECRQTEDRRFPVETSIGRDLQIVTSDQSGAEHIVFDGFVLGGKLRYEITGSYTAVLSGITRSYKLDLTLQEMYFRKKSLSDVAQSLASQDGLIAAVNCKLLPPKNYVQWGESDFNFLKRIVYEHQGWICPNAQGIEIRDQFRPGSKLVWREEQGLLNFSVKGRISSPAFNGTHYDARHMSSTSFKSVANAPNFFGSSAKMAGAVQKASTNLSAGYAHLDCRAATQSEYSQLLERESCRSVGRGVTAHGISMNDGLRPGDTVDVQGTPDADGTYGLTGVIHRWRRTGYENEFWCTPWQQYILPDPPKPARISGFVPARVVSHNDPRKMGRLQVQYDWLADGQTGWARMSTPHAGGDRGFMFMPEIGDEVLLGFEHGDPERPYVVGSLWNGVDQAPREEFWGGDIAQNDVKRIVTKSGHRIQLSDQQGKESIIIATPNHLKLGMLENADETNRPILLAHSDNGDIVLSAPNGRIHFHSQYFSREIGDGDSVQSVSAPKPPAPTPPLPDFAAQAAALRLAATSGAALCAP